jgi:predicted SnoaL-like aldol condensation-catalyzing enzyme
VSTFLGAVIQNDPASMRALAVDNYIQHNPFIPTGLEPFIQMLTVLEENGNFSWKTQTFLIQVFQAGSAPSLAGESG